MIPILYTPDEREFLSNGLGLLAETVDSTVEWNCNGAYELELVYPVAGLRFGEIARNRIILATPDPVTRAQPFRIYRIGKQSRGLVTVYAQHAAYDARGIPVAPFTAQTAQEAFGALETGAVVEHPFSLICEHPGVGELRSAVPADLWGLLGKGLETYGGELEFDRWDITLKRRIGADRGFSVRYGKNLTTLEQDENISACYTAVYPYWTDREGALVELPEKILQAPGNHDHVKVLMLPLQFDSRPTEEELRTAAVDYMEKNAIGTPVVSWKIGFVPDLGLEQLGRGDSVTVHFPALGVHATARAVQTRYKPLLERFDSVTLGSVRQSVADTIVSQKKEIELARKESRDYLSAATAWLTNGKGYMAIRLNADGSPMDTLYMDHPDISQAVNVLRIGQSGIGFSHNGVEGPYVSAWTLDGQFYADSVHLSGKFGIYKDGILQGYMGYREGSSGETLTTGICVSDAAGECYAIATEAGVRLQAGSSAAYLEKNGRFVVSGNLEVKGTIIN